MNQEYIIDKILDKKINDDFTVSYFIKWMGYSSSENSWEPYVNLKNVQPLIDDFEEKFNKRTKGEQVEDIEMKEVKEANKDIIMKKEPEKLIKMKTVNNNLFFVVRWKDSEETEETYKFIRDNFPYLLISFFERRIKLGDNYIQYNSQTNEYKFISN